MLLAAVSASCSHQSGGKTEQAVEESVDRFHDQLNQQRFHEIYNESDLELRGRITETEFTAQLLDAHNQLGTVTSKANVIIDESFWVTLKRGIGGRRDHVTHGSIAEGDQIFADEVFVWAVGAGQPRLVSYKLGGATCRKPCRLGWGKRSP